MMRYIFLILVAVLFSCNDDTDKTICTSLFVYGLNVTVKDASTNDILIGGVTVVAIDGTYEETLTNIQGSDFFVGAGEREGSYVITASAAGYLSETTANPVKVDADECHVIPVALELFLQPE